MATKRSNLKSDTSPGRFATSAAFIQWLNSPNLKGDIGRPQPYPSAERLKILAARFPSRALQQEAIETFWKQVDKDCDAIGHQWFP